MKYFISGCAFFLTFLLGALFVVTKQSDNPPTTASSDLENESRTLNYLPTPVPASRLATLDVSMGVLNEKADVVPRPVYPAAAKALKAAGTVNVNVIVSKTGRVVMASAVSGHPLLRASAEDAARKAKFSPTMLNGTPVRVVGVLTYNFPPKSR